MPEIQTPVPDLAKKVQEDKVLANKVLSEKKVYASSTDSWRKDIQEIWKAINGELSENVYPWANPQFIPKMRTEISFVVPFIFSGDPELEVTLVGDEDKELSFILDKMLSYRVEKNAKFYNTALAWVTQGVGLGTSMLKISWMFKQNQGGVVDRPLFSVPNILDIYQHPAIYETSDQTSVIERIAMTVADVKASELYNENKMKVTPTGKTAGSTTDSKTMNDTDLNDTDSLDNEFKMVDIYERWTKDKIITVADSSGGPVLLRDVPNPYGFIPFVKFIFENELIPNRCNGKGVGQNTLGLQELYYDLFNLVALNLKIVVNKMWRIDPGSRVSPNDLIARPGGTIRATKDEAEPVMQDDLKQSGFQMLNLISEEHKRASGATDLIQGSPGARTLGQDQLAQSNSSNRFELVRRRLKSSLSEMGWMLLKMELQNLQSVDSEIMKIFPETERQNIFDLLISVRDTIQFDVFIKGDTVLATNKDILAKQMLDLYNLISVDLLPQERRYYAQEIARMRGMNNVKELIPDAQMPQIDPLTGQPIAIDPKTGLPMPNPMEQMQNEQQGPVDGNALPKMAGAPTAEGVNESTYGFENRRI